MIRLLPMVPMMMAFVPRSVRVVNDFGSKTGDADNVRLQIVGGAHDPGKIVCIHIQICSDALLNNV